MNRNEMNRRATLTAFRAAATSLAIADRRVAYRGARDATDWADFDMRVSERVEVNPTSVDFLVAAWEVQADWAAMEAAVRDVLLRD